jgi:oligopeptide transport system substrate-binding protein
VQHVRRAIVALVVMTVIAISVLPALSRSSVTASAPTPTSKRHVPVSSRTLPTLRLSMPDVSPTIDPALAADDSNAELASLMYEGLVRLDAHYRVVPAAAARFTVAPDHRTYTFYLRHDLHFSNGQRITAYDFRFAITRSLDPAVKSPSAPTYLFDIQGARAKFAGKAKTVSGIKVINDYTIQLKARWPVPYFLMELTYPTSYALDQRAITKLGPADNTSWYSNPVASGPYRLKSWIPNVKMVLVPNKHFAGSRPQLKQIVISLTPLPVTGLYHYVTNSLDIVSLPSNSRTLVHAVGVHETKMLAIDGIYMNLNRKPFNDQDVRRALTLALDRTALVRQSLGNSVTPFGGYVPPGENGYDPHVRLLPSNNSAARAALKAGLAGKRFPNITLYYADDPSLAQLADSVAKSWHRNLGITVGTSALTVNTLLAKVQTGSLPLYLGGWSADYPDPHDWLSLQWQSDALNNNVHYASKTFDQLTEAADVTWKPSKRASLDNQAQQVLVHDAAWIPLYIPHRLVYIRPQVRNITLTGYGLIPTDGAWARVGIAPTTVRMPHAF